MCQEQIVERKSPGGATSLSAPYGVQSLLRDRLWSVIPLERRLWGHFNQEYIIPAWGEIMGYKFPRVKDLGEDLFECR